MESAEPVAVRRLEPPALVVLRAEVVRELVNAALADEPWRGHVETLRAIDKRLARWDGAEAPTWVSRIPTNWLVGSA